ncbi:MAG: multisubunit Na+/H+ antiporter MnhB subunit [Paraglaciecola sp.]|jgi:multisubunit Na+/H+ antiporter MnhB subunit
MFSYNQTSPKPSPTGLLLVSGLVIFIFCLGLILTLCLLVAPVPSFEAAIAAYTNLTKSGVSNPVTAVLLNFRSYDTLLELAVLFAVVVIVLPTNKTYRIESTADVRFSQIATLNLVRKILPLTIVMSGYLLWTGASQPGGAFQAGALLAGCGLMALFSEAISIHFEHNLWRFALAAALAAFIFAGAVTHWLTGGFLLYPTDQAGLFIISIEFVATFSIGITLVLFYWVIATIDQVSKPSSHLPALPVSHQGDAT